MSAIAIIVISGGTGVLVGVVGIIVTARSLEKRTRETTQAKFERCLRGVDDPR